MQKLCPPAPHRSWLATVAFATLLLTGYAADTFTVASFNVENYLLEPAGTRPAKSPESRSAVQRTLLTLRADVVALQEIGGIGALEELRGALRAGGLEYPYSELVGGYDTNIQVAVLSRLPILERRPHTNEGFLLRGRRFRTTRGIAELELQVTPHYRVTLINVHLKSQRETAEAAEDEIREQESLILRKIRL